LGDGQFDADGQLVRLGEFEVSSPVLDVWRAPIDNDRDFSWEAQEPGWRELGLDRLQHRVDQVHLDSNEVVVHSRVAPAATTLGFRVSYRWTSVADGLRLQVDVEPEGDWRASLPRLGVRMSLPAELDRIEWFGTGPGESYPDSARAVRVGRFVKSVDEWQTPYVYPQENGHRSDVRWAALTDGNGSGLLVEGQPTVGLTVRRWTTEDLAAARHTNELLPSDRLWLNIDAGHNGLGSASCGPGVLARYRLQARPTSFALLLRTTRTGNNLAFQA
jgi:beta-galactosidase